MRFEIECPQQGNGTPAVTATFSRVNLIMGANGTGKSKLLLWLAGNSATVFPGFLPVYIEDSHIMQIPVDAQINQGTYRIINDPDQYLEEQYLNRRIGNLHERILHLLVLLRGLDEREKILHSDRVDDWNRSGRSGAYPDRKPSLQDQLCSLFSEIFPSLSLFMTPTPQLYCRREGGSQEYPVITLSQGEKQAFVTIADLLLLSREPSVFLIDEPELNLHATLADRLWSSTSISFRENSLTG